MGERAGDITTDDLDVAHRRLVAGDAGARDGLFDAGVAAWPQVTAVLRAKLGPRVDEDAAWNFLVDALLKLADGDSRFDPNRGGLFHYLVLEVHGDLLNHERGEGRRRGREAFVAQPDVAADGAAGYVEREWDAARLAEAVRLVGERDGAFLRAVHAGAGRARLAELLGVGTTAAEDGRDEAIRRTVDRIRVRLKRANKIGGVKKP